jgi:hypothetical protein
MNWGGRGGLKKLKKNWKLLWVAEPRLEFNPSPPTNVFILDENINIIPNLKSPNLAARTLQSIARWLSTTIQLTPGLQ